MTAILDAASEAFSLMGVRNATMGEIADRAGMARANLYYNFASKEEMAAALAERYRAKGYAEAPHLKAHEASAAHFLDAFFTYAGEWTRS
ncbi:helix-turn-helix domain-containing protein [Rhizorhabdus dicambivorans]|nr:helix-turn-helix domain-containing protein [Rhizorhabdus dicambivorans]